MRFFIAGLWLAVVVCACGQSGDLYLPGKTPPPSAPEDSTAKKKSPATQPAAPAPQEKP